MITKQKFLRKSIIWIGLLSVTLFSYSLGNSIDFEDNLNTIYSGIANSYSDLNFNQRGNNFEWIVFRRDYSTPSTGVTIDLWSSRLVCHKQVRWFYYNNQRWFRVWALDQDTLTSLRSVSSNYYDVTYSWWFYFACDGVDANTIYGQITHTWKWINYELVVWIEPNFSANSFYPYFSWSLRYSSFSWYLRDNYWWIAKVSQWIWIISPTDFLFDSIYDAELDTDYKSNKIIISWLPSSSTRILAMVSDWDLFVNWTNVWYTYLVKNWDELQIQLRSSTDFDDSVESELTVGLKSSIFNITTVVDGTYELTTSEKLQIIVIVNTLQDYYKNDPVKQSQFLNTFKTMLKDKIDIMKSDIENWDSALSQLDIRKLSILEYFYDRLLDYIDQNVDNSNDWDIYVAPNGKKYTILFDDERQAYTSNNFTVKKYFATLDTMKQYIDINNKSDWTQNVNGNSTLIAPNWKVYLVRKVVDNVRTSPDFLETKYFYSFQALRDYIYTLNSKAVVRNHQIDTAFGKLPYTAPNGKYYDIYKTTTWKYFSYKMGKPIYFDSITSIKKYINLYNKK